MGTSDPIASTTSLLSTNTTSSSFDPNKKKDRTKRPPLQKDYAAALSALQCRYGLPDDSTYTYTPLPPPSRRSATPQYLPTPANPAGSALTSSARVAPLPAKKKGEEKAKAHPSPLALLWARYRSSGSSVPPSPLFSSPSKGEGLSGNADEKIGKADVAVASHPIG
jgi:hypothetical protein